MRLQSLPRRRHPHARHHRRRRNIPLRLQLHRPLRQASPSIARTHPRRHRPQRHQNIGLHHPPRLARLRPHRRTPTRQAAYTQQVIAKFAAQNPQRFIVFGGDLNDTPADQTVIDIEKDGILIRDAKNLPPSAVYTWGNKVAFDHLFHNAPLSPHWAKTTRICNDNPTTGLGTSDHCALKSTYTFPLDGEL